MLFEDLPTELLLEILTILDYKSLAALAQTSRHFQGYASDNIIWRALYTRSFSRTRHVPCEMEWRNDYATRIASLRELIIRGTNDYQARTVRSIFSEMDVENGKLLADMIEASYVSLRDILVEGQGYALANAQRLIPGWTISGISSFFRRNHDRLHMDPRSEVHLIRMLLARHTGFQMGVTNVETFLKCAHLITYNSVDHPLYFFPPAIYDPTSATDKERYNLRSAVPKHVTTESGSGPVINWGVVETIHSLIKLYRDRMGEAIPRFVKSDDDYESEVPMVPAMFDADLAGNWKGLYGYLDFRELEVLDSTRAFTPDFFDGLQTLKIGHEEDYDLLSHPLDHGEVVERHFDQEQATELEGGPEFEMYLSDDDQQETITIEDAEGVTSQRKYRFVADGTSLHGHFHIHGSTIRQSYIHLITVTDQVRYSRHGSRIQNCAF